MSCTYVCSVDSVVSDSLWLCRMWPARLLCQGGRFFMQEYQSILANTGCHTLLEHYISCYPSHQFSWVPGAARTPVSQAAAPPNDLVFTGENPSPPEQPQEQTPVDNPYAELKIKPQLKPGAVWLRKKTKNSPTSCTSWRLNPHDQLGRFCVCGIHKISFRAPTKENTLVLIAVDIGGNNTEE